MSKTGKENGFSFKRLEDFVDLAKSGREIQMEINLRKQMVTKKVHPLTQRTHKEETYSTNGEIDTCLLTGDFIFTVEGVVHELSKVYMFALQDESAATTRANRNIANARLQVDYGRLKGANIKFEEKFF